MDDRGELKLVSYKWVSSSDITLTILEKKNLETQRKTLEIEEARVKSANSMKFDVCHVDV